MQWWLQLGLVVEAVVEVELEVVFVAEELIQQLSQVDLD